MRLPRLLLLLCSALSGVLLAASLAAAATDFAQPGPCKPVSWSKQYTVPSQLPDSLPKTLAVTFTIPDCPAGSELPFSTPFPVLFFFNGFEFQGSWYSRLMQQAASWGLLTTQYTLPIFPLPDAADEVQLFPYLAQWVAGLNADPGSPLYGQMDTSRFIIGGHSRGGKLATLMFTGNQEVLRSAYLVDPVDVTIFTPESPKNPSAVRALAASGRSVGITGAGINNSCNPADAGYRPMFAAAGNGSWLLVIPDSSHSQFIDGGAVINFAADLLCGKGKDSRQEVAALTTTPMLAWFWEQLVGQGQASQGGDSPIPAFLGWVSEQELSGKLTWQLKGSLAAEAAVLAGTAVGTGGLAYV